MEFSVNLTKLGLDPVSVFGGDICGTPFNRMVVKTRASASFTAELKDFVAPIDLFLAPRVDAITDVPIYCGSMGVSNVFVQNPSSSSVYTWTTPNGNIVSSNASGTSITVDRPGTYIVTQQLASGCSPYARDTVTIVFDGTCVPMDRNILEFKGIADDKKTLLSWTTTGNEFGEYFDVERSTDAKTFLPVGRVGVQTGKDKIQYRFEDAIEKIRAPFVYYRLKMRSTTTGIQYSRTIRLATSKRDEITFYPNPAQNEVQLSINAAKKEMALVQFYTLDGRAVLSKNLPLAPGNNTFTLDEVQNWTAGLYLVKIQIGYRTEWQKLAVNKGSSKSLFE
jgi:hypothetical protein